MNHKFLYSVISKLQRESIAATTRYGQKISTDLGFLSTRGCCLVAITRGTRIIAWV